MNSLFFFLFIFFHLSFHSNFPSTVGATTSSSPVSPYPNKLIIKVCMKSDDFKFCLQVMKSKPRILSAKNITTVANFALAEARKRSKIARNFFNRIAAGASKNLSSMKVLKQCATYFDETVGMFNLSGLEGGTATLDVHYALDNCGYCETTLDSANARNRSINSTINTWKSYFSIAYSTVEIIENETPVEP